MKGRIWIGGALLVMMLLGILGCSKKRDPMINDGMMDGPGSVYTPEDQSPFAGTWHSADERVMLEIESGGPFEKSRMKLTVDGEVKLASDMWVHTTGKVKLTEGYDDILLPEPFQHLEFFHSLDAFSLSDNDGTVYMLARPGVEPPDHPLFQALKGMYEGGSQDITKRRCSSCGEEGERAFCTECGNRLI